MGLMLCCIADPGGSDGVPIMGIVVPAVLVAIAVMGDAGVGWL